MSKFFEIRSIHPKMVINIEHIMSFSPHHPTTTEPMKLIPKRIGRAAADREKSGRTMLTMADGTKLHVPITYAEFCEFLEKYCGTEIPEYLDFKLKSQKPTKPKRKK